MKPVALFFQSTWSKSWRDKLTGAFQYADQVGWHIQVVEATTNSTKVRDILQKWNPIGCMVDRGLQNSRPPLRLFGKIPVVFLDQYPKMARTCTYLTHDSRASVILAMDELIRIGLPRLAFLPWSKPCFWNTERNEAFGEYARQKRIKHFILTPDNDLDRQLAELPKPCGVICANDMSAQKMMSEAMRAGVAIPDELAVIGIDNDELICEHTNPPLSSVYPSFVDAGYRLAEMLHERVRNPKAKHIHASYGPKTLVRRESSRWMPNMDDRTRDALDFIRKNFTDPDLTVGQVVEVMGCSRSMADLLFRKSSGGSILDEIQSMRLENAYRLLRNPQQKIDSIPTLCGYASEPFFKRLFKKKTGLTMREWRKQNVTQRA
ncbi:MAG: substrate-binding domain-containing protein [bacterium]|nr:substrate-binding domain-containing protein [Candidatus Colisoma equi]